MAKTSKSAAPLARPAPSQRRSRERYERILETAAALLIEQGADAFRMSDVVERSGVPFGSLYQYFADKTALIGALAERYNETGRACVAAALAEVRSASDLHSALCRITDEYYAFFVGEPVVRHIWAATQANPMLQKLDAEDMEALSKLLIDASQRVLPNTDRKALGFYARLTMQLIAAAVRHAITLDRRRAEASLTLFKRMLPRNVATLLA